MDLFFHLAKHLPLMQDPLEKILGSAGKKQKSIRRKCQVISRHLSPRDQIRAARSLVDSMRKPSARTDGAEIVRNIRSNMRCMDDCDTRRPDETLWAFFTRRFNNGVRPRDLPARLDVPGEFVGIELEFVPPLDEDVGEDEAPVSRIPYNSAPFGSEFHHDGSVRTGDDLSVEIDGYTEAVILLRPPRMARLHKLCDQLRSMGCHVNETCGVHVHVDVRHLTDVARLYERVKILIESMPVFATLTASRRISGPRADRYCRFGVSPRFGNPDEHYDASRYWAINLCSIPRQGTVEVRLFHGTLDSGEIEGWALLIRHTLLFADTPVLSEEDLARVADRLGLTEWASRLTRRTHRFSLADCRRLLNESAYAWGEYSTVTGRVSRLSAFEYGTPPVRAGRSTRRRSAVPEPILTADDLSFPDDITPHPGGVAPPAQREDDPARACIARPATVRSVLPRSALPGAFRAITSEDFHRIVADAAIDSSLISRVHDEVIIRDR